ncbi:guanine nucleotide exchange factor C9orf72 homolog isoform 6-T6 [Menidia menidia]
MSCPPQSPAAARSEVAVEGECPLLAATFAHWDNILGPRVRHLWVPRGAPRPGLSEGELSFLANHTLNGEILRSAESGAVDVKFFVLAEKGVIIVSLIFDGELKGDKNTCALSVVLPQAELSFYLPLHAVCVERLKLAVRKGRICMQKVRGYNIISVLSLEIVPIMELLASMKSHSVPEDIDIKGTVLNDDDIGDSCHEDFLHKAISSHLQTCGCSIVVGSNPDKVNKVVRTLCLFLTPAERRCSRLCRPDSSFRYDTGLFVQGLLKDSAGSFVLPFRQVLYSPYPSTHIDVDINAVQQMAPCHQHFLLQRRYVRAELRALWRAQGQGGGAGGGPGGGPGPGGGAPPGPGPRPQPEPRPQPGPPSPGRPRPQPGAGSGPGAGTRRLHPRPECFPRRDASRHFSEKLYRRGVPAEGGGPAELLPGSVPAAAPQEGAHAAQVHRGRHAEGAAPVPGPAGPEGGPGSMLVLTLTLTLTHRQKGRRPFRGLRGLKADLALC